MSTNSPRTEVFPVGNALAGSDWQGLVASAIRVRRDRLERSAKTGLWKASSETAYYVASFEPTAPFAAHAIRRHWGIENRLHYTRDGTMAEDASRVRKNPGIMARMPTLTKKRCLSLIELIEAGQYFLAAEALERAFDWDEVPPGRAYWEGGCTENFAK